MVPGTKIDVEKKTIFLTVFLEILRKCQALQEKYAQTNVILSVAKNLKSRFLVANASQNDAN